MKAKDLLGLSFRVIGLIFASIGAIAAVNTTVFVRRAETVLGTVIDYAVEQNSISFLQSAESTGMLYYPIVEYPASRGRTSRVTGRSGSPTRAYEPGEQIPVLVSTSNPERARINTVLGVWGTAIILGGLGAIFLLLSVLAPLGFGGSKQRT